MKKVVLFPIALLLCFHAFSRDPKRDRLLFMGFNFGANYSSLHAATATPVTTKNINTVNGLGYDLGLLAGLNLSRHFSIAAKPSLVFNDSRIGIVRYDNSIEKYEQPVSVLLAVHATYKMTKRLLKPYFFAGPGYRLPVPMPQSAAIQLVRPIVSMDAGIGCEKKFHNVVVAPELRYAHGINNIADIAGISTLKMNSVMFVINFSR